MSISISKAFNSSKLLSIMSITESITVELP
nr:MAG TPA: hypothetical protein [Bacteriophage sp.]